MAAGSDRTFETDPDIAFDACQKAVAHLGWSIAARDPQGLTLTAETPLSLLPTKVRDVVEVDLAATDDGVTVSVAASPKYQPFDWGTGDDHEETFLTEVEREIERSGPDRTP